ncbi:bardet-Biedl syndrome 2 protein [Thecamonas trahens ATCC 50062]|uniref:Bardet-Biedl syndrome 2 protein n=1 Tax=Thecamonas trahens ATCC 50062 TaxID=461836 RepID=A0A0L0DKV4_THETB|nr:bardet-Biedl syndrome 2 protein [Thecamonas trahens ATCC 50062]KNC53004.1 bardet-Biedl syndrome 2 protein [Thecamonas trahens ATCC 50062]|eukprot:XP_013754891.1 bardet-Biedl syndrome 2 protein [Thecamonas trahens ATCC 50062]
MSLTPAFRFKLPHTVREGLVAIGKFDGRTPSLVFATSGGKVGVHAPHGPAGGTEVSFLAVNLTLTALATGPLVSDGRDVLVMGTETLLLMYDVQENADVLYKEVEDGVFSLVIGLPPGAAADGAGAPRSPLVYVGGNCSLQGFDVEGKEQYWTVTGDNVTALEMCDVEGDGIPELLVGSEDYEIRIYKDDEVISEITESAEIVALTAMHEFVYAFALRDRHPPTAQVAFDLDMDGVAEIVTGFADGTLQVRRQDTGKLMYVEKMDDGIAALLVADYRCEGKDQLVVVCVNGAIRGYRAEDVHGEGAATLAALRGDAPLDEPPTRPDANAHLGFADTVDGDDGAKAASADASMSPRPSPTPLAPHELSSHKISAARATAILGKDPLQEKLDALLEEKHRLSHQLQTTSSNTARFKSADATPDEELVPTNTRVDITLVPNYSTNSVDLVVETSNETVLAAVTLTADHLFEQQSMLVHPDEALSSVRVAIIPQKDTEQYVDVTSLVGYRGASFFQVFSDRIRFPRFAAYLPVDKAAVQIPNEGIVVRIAERASQLYVWLRSRFLFNGLNVEASGMDIALSSLRDGHIVGIQFFEDRGLLHLKSHSIEFLGELVQDLADFLHLDHVDSQAEFPSLMAAFSSTLTQVKAFHSTRQKLSTDMAETANLAKTLVVKAEDARILGDMHAMKQHYSALAALNRDLLTEFTKRKNNHSALLEKLRDVHRMIQRAARLRRGEPAKRVIAACRKALADSNMPALIHAICSGGAAET